MLVLPVYKVSIRCCLVSVGLASRQGQHQMQFSVRQKIREFQRYEVHTISFQTFFVQAFKIVVDSWNFNMLLLHILWDDWPNFRISGSNQQIQQQLEYILLKPDCYSWWISKMQSEREDTLEERYAIKFCFKLEKKKCHRNVWNASDCFWSILHESSISFWVA